MLRILLVEDDAFVGPALQVMLSFGARATLVHDCATALRTLEAGVFDVVVSDVDLGPGRDGLSLLDEVAERWPSLRRIAMSGVDRATDQTFIMKPLGPHELAVILDRSDLAPRSRTVGRLSEPPRSDVPAEGRAEAPSDVVPAAGRAEVSADARMPHSVDDRVRHDATDGTGR